MSDEEIKEVKKELLELFSKMDLRKSLKILLYRGFDNYEDYFKYGEIFVPLMKEENKCLVCGSGIFEPHKRGRHFERKTAEIRLLPCNDLEE